MAQPALIDGVPALVWSQGGQPRVVFGFTFAGDQVVAIDLFADPELIAELDLEFLDGDSRSGSADLTKIACASRVQ